MSPRPGLKFLEPHPESLPADERGSLSTGVFGSVDGTCSEEKQQLKNNLSKDTLEALSRAIVERREEMLKFLERIVNTDSPTEDKMLSDRVGDILQEKAETLGMTCIRDPQTEFADNRVCRFVPGSQPDTAPRILMIGHFDTVYAAGTTNERPFHVDGDIGYGPGTLDMKGGLTVALFGLQALREVYGEIPLATTFIFNGDEEIGSPCSRQLVIDEAAHHDLVLVFEPGRPGPCVTRTRKGVGIFYLDVEGVEAHAGIEPEKGANSILEMAHKIVEISALNDAEIGTVVTPGVIEGGTKPYVVPGACRLSVDSRVPTIAEQERIVRGLEAITEKTWVSGTKSHLEGSFHRPPMEASAKSLEYIDLLQQVSREVGFPLGAASTGGASDANLTAAAGTPTIDGLGLHGGRAHSGDEFIEIPSITAKCEVFAGFLGSLAAGASQESDVA